MRAGLSGQFGSGSGAKPRPSPGGDGGFFPLSPKRTFWDGLKLLPFFLMCMGTNRHFDPITTASLLLTVTPRGRTYVLLTFQRRTQWVRVVM